ncbi:MAG: peptidase S10, partial [Actinomycetota bacterium]|nr:peptidase S10 [Actinomycetota bacterium]
MTQTTDSGTTGSAAGGSGTGDTPAEPGRPAAAEPRDDLTVTQHEITVDGAPLRYTVTTGRLVLRKEQSSDASEFEGHKATAEVFTVAYTLDGAAPGRPVTFAFNGGPGSSSAWLHLGLLGPRRV